MPQVAARMASRDENTGRYQRHRTEQTLLYRIVDEYYPVFNAHLVEQGRELPAYVRREFEDYLKCGRLEHGFLRARCESCHATHLVKKTGHTHDPMTPLLGHSITYRIALGPQAGRKVFTPQTLPASDEPFDDGVGKVAGFSLHAGVAARADERKKLERLSEGGPAGTSAAQRCRKNGCR